MWLFKGDRVRVGQSHGNIVGDGSEPPESWLVADHPLIVA